MEELQKLGLDQYTVIIMTDNDTDLHKVVDDFCRKHDIKFILAQTAGPFSQIFCDYGDKFTVVDTNGEESKEFLIQSISSDEQGLVKLHKGVRHDLQDGDVVVFHEVEGMMLA